MTRGPRPFGCGGDDEARERAALDKIADLRAGGFPWEVVMWTLNHDVARYGPRRASAGWKLPNLRHAAKRAGIS